MDRCCHRYSTDCTNLPAVEGGYECGSCRDGFVGTGVGPIGCVSIASLSHVSKRGCDGVPLSDGGSEMDQCGICGGDNSTCVDCSGEPNGVAVTDRCGSCRDPSRVCTKDCRGKWGGGTAKDVCGICGGDNSTCVDCAGQPHGLAVMDRCDRCVVKVEACVADCNGVWGGNKIVDQCGQCGGDGICRRVVRVSIDLPGDVAMCSASSIGSIEAAVAASTGLAEKYVDVDTCVVGDVGMATVLTFYLHVEYEGRRRLQFDSLLVSLSFGLAAATGVDERELTTGVPETLELDCAGEPGGAATSDGCNVCDVSTANDNTTCADCTGTPNGNSIVDRCGSCDSDPDNDCALDCTGEWGGPATVDLCTVCGGDDSSCADCAGSADGNAAADRCGTCDSDPTNDCIRDCAGEWGGTSTTDACIVCNGDGSTCAARDDAPDAQFSFNSPSPTTGTELQDDLASKIGTVVSAISVQCVNVTQCTMYGGGADVAAGRRLQITLAGIIPANTAFTVIVRARLLGGVDMATALMQIDDFVVEKSLIDDTDYSNYMKCPNGYYKDIASGGSCERCSPGSEPNAAWGATQCNPCKLRVTSSTTSWASLIGDKCTLCPAGRGSDEAFTRCDRCPSGQFNDRNGGDCRACPRTHMVPNNIGAGRARTHGHKVKLSTISVSICYRHGTPTCNHTRSNKSPSAPPCRHRVYLRRWTLRRSGGPACVLRFWRGLDNVRLPHQRPRRTSTTVFAMR